MERCRLVADRLAMLEDGVKHHAKYSQENRDADRHHQVVELVNLACNLCDRSLEIQLADRWTSLAIVDCPGRHACDQQ